MDNESNTIREFFAKYYLPEWFKFNLPDLLWVFGFTSVMLIIWESVQSKIKFFYIILPLFIGVASELLQYFIPNFGTFDLTDILFYTIGSLTSILILKTINQSKYEKQITTSF
jgi:VanZ family protein